MEDEGQEEKEEKLGVISEGRHSDQGSLRKTASRKWILDLRKSRKPGGRVEEGEYSNLSQ